MPESVLDTMSAVYLTLGTRGEEKLVYTPQDAELEQLAYDFSLFMQEKGIEPLIFSTNKSGFYRAAFTPKDADEVVAWLLGKGVLLDKKEEGKTST